MKQSARSPASGPLQTGGPFYRAEPASWSGSVPIVPDASRHDLHVLRWTIHELWRFYGIRSRHRVVRDEDGRKDTVQSLLCSAVHRPSETNMEYVPNGFQQKAVDGVGDQEVDVADPPGPYYVATSQTSPYRLVQMQVSQGSNTVTFTNNMTISGNGSFGLITCSVTPDTRGITISSDCGGNCKSMALSVNGEVPMTDSYGNIEYSPAPEPRDSAGTGYGDIGLPDWDGQEPDYPAATEPVTYTANRVGQFSLNGDTDHWYDSLHGTSLSDTITRTSPNISPFTVNYTERDVNPDGGRVCGDQGSTDHLFISYYDGTDGAEATGNFWMKIHETSEATSCLGPTDSFDWPQPVTTTGSPYTILGGGVSCSWEQNNYLSAESLSAGSDAFQVISSLTGGWMGALLTLAGIVTSDLTTPQQGISALDDGGETWTNPHSVIETDPGVDTPDPGSYYMEPTCWLTYQKQPYEIDNWDMTGYAGQQFKLIAKETQARFAGIFTLITEGPPS